MLAVKAEKLTKKYGSLTAVGSLEVGIEKGEFFALLGVNGAGKTTTIKMLSGLSRPSSGDAFLMGHSIVSDSENARAVLNLSPQETAVAPNLTARENLELISRIYGQSAKNAGKKAGEMIALLQLESVAERRAKKLSGGWQRRLSIAMSLVTEPKILFLDEPTLGLDVIARRELWNVIGNLKGRVTIILTTHYLEEAQALADRIGIMAGGKLMALGTVSELINRTGAKNFEDAFIALASEGEAQ